MDAFARARAETINYHEQYYGKHKLFQSGSWLSEPDPKVAELSARVSSITNCSILDLGAGVGRNAIPIAKALSSGSQVVCVELITSATDQLKRYAREHQVADRITVVNDDFEKVSFSPAQFDLVLGISTLEHCSSYENLVALVTRLQQWTKPSGLNYFNFSTSRKVVSFETGEPIETLVETRLQTEAWLERLASLYSSWNIEKLATMEPYSEVLEYNGARVRWSSDELEILASKKESS